MAPRCSPLDFFHRILFWFTRPRIGPSDAEVEIRDLAEETVVVKDAGPALWPSEKYALPQVLTAPTMATRISGMFLSLIHYLPVIDKLDVWSSVEESRHYIETEFNISFDEPRFSTMYQKNVKIADMSLVDRCIFLAKYGVGAHLTKNDGDTCVIDLSSMKAYEVRPGIVPYGCVVEFTAGCEKLTSITLMATPPPHFGEAWVPGKVVVRPGDRLFATAFNVFSASLLAHVTLSEHAMFCHLFAAGGMLRFVHENMAEMSEDLRKFLSIFLYQTAEVNTSAMSVLVRPGGIIYRLFGFTDKATQKYLLDCLKQFESRKNLSFLDETPNSPFTRDASMFYHKIVVKFATDIVDVLENPLSEVGWKNLEAAFPALTKDLSASEKLIRVISRHIFTVSMWHEQIGNMAWYVLHPGCMKTKVYQVQPDSVYETRQGSLQAIHLALLTSSNKMPRIGEELEKGLPEKYHKSFRRWRKRQAMCIFQCSHLNVENLECSVSL